MVEGLRKRAKHTRSRLGCRVCRIRRVRCDVTQPACIKCTSTGRKCEWYPPKDDPSTVSCIVRCDSALSSHIDPAENRFLSYFRGNTVYHLTGSCKVDFWDTVIFQISDSEPCIRYGIVALGALHEAFQDEHFTNSRLFPHETELGHCGWLYYVKAIEHLNMHMNFEGWKGVDVALLCCILCVSFECLRGCYVAAETHLRSGLAILNQWLENEKHHDSSDEVLSASSSRANLIKQHLVPLFSRLISQTRTFIATPVPCTALLASEQKATPLPHLKAARDELHGIISQTNTCTYLQQPVSPEEKEKTHAKILSRLCDWHDTHYASLAPDDDVISDSVSLRISYTLITIMVHTSLSNDQMQFDAFDDDFALIVQLVHGLSSHGSNSDVSASVALEVVPVLLYVALKCRHPLIRRRALSLITACNRRELPWDSNATARIAWEIISIEEEQVEGVHGSGRVDQGRRVDRLYSWSDLYQRDSLVKFRRQGDRTWSGTRLVVW